MSLDEGNDMKEVCRQWLLKPTDFPLSPLGPEIPGGPDGPYVLIKTWTIVTNFIGIM